MAGRAFMGVAAVLLALGPAVPAEAGAEAVIELTVQKTMPGGVVGVHGTGLVGLAAVYAVPLFLFVHVVLPARAEDPADGLPPVQIEALALFVAFAAGSYAFAAWFHWAPEPAAARRGGRGAG